MTSISHSDFRTFYKPVGAVVVTDNATRSTVYAYQIGTRFGAIGFTGRRRKPTFHYTFKSLAAREAYVIRFLAAERASATAKAERQAQRKAEAAKPHGLKVGDVFSCSWGYEQTNVDFYEVVAVVGARSLDLRKIASQTEPGTDTPLGMSCKVVPAAGHFVGAAIRKRIGAHNTIRVSDYQTARLWDGKPRYCSWYA